MNHEHPHSESDVKMIDPAGKGFVEEVLDADLPRELESAQG